MTLEVTCPYCGYEFNDDVEDIDESENYEAECPNCQKILGYNISISIDTDSYELPCGGQDGEGPHDWNPRIGIPVEYFKNKFYCAHCGLKKEIVPEE